MMPASFSYPGAIEDVGSRIFLRIDSASRREPTWVRSGAITCPWPSSLWQARQPAAWMIALGSALPPAKTPPPAVVEVGEGVGGFEGGGISEAVTLTRPPWASRDALTGHT